MSPPRWHIGHVSWFYDKLLQEYNSGYKTFSLNFGNYLNSYYQTFGEPFDKGKRGTVSRPTVAETQEYFFWINKQIDQFIQGSKSLSADIKYLLYLAINHEYQHQELLIYDLQHLLQEKYIPKTRNKIHNIMGQSSMTSGEMIKIPGGIFEMGFNIEDWNEPFWYDIESPLHKVYLNDFKIDAMPVTNHNYLDFIEDGGYKKFSFWLSDGWEIVCNQRWQAPLYWQLEENGAWCKSDFRGKQKIKDIGNEPVTNVSYYEAWAYARWAGKRLPTEAEWEKAAAWDEDKMVKHLYPWGNEPANDNNSNLLESHLWHTIETGSLPTSRSYYGCHQMISDMWEWTSSEFMPYPGFQTGFAEYNDKWFGNQKVLRGGSFATSRHQARNTYRNFFRCPERWMIAGFRCAKDV